MTGAALVSGANSDAAPTVIIMTGPERFYPCAFRLPYVEPAARREERARPAGP